MQIDLQEYGRLTAQVEHLKKDVDELRNDMRKVLETLQQARGGWRFLLLICGASASAGALITKLVPVLGRVWP